MNDMPQDIQRQFDYVVAKFQETIKKFDESEKVNRAIQQEYQDIKELVKGLEAKFDALSNDVSSSIKVINNAILAQGNKNEVFQACHLKTSSAYDELRGDVEKLAAESASASAKIKVSADAIELLKGKIDTIDQKYAPHAGAIAGVVDSVDFCRVKLIKLEDRLVQAESVLNGVQVFAGKTDEELSDLGTHVDESVRRLEGFIAALQGNQSQMVQAMPKLISEKIAAIPQPVIPSLDEVKLAFEKQLEPVALDAKNAYVRSQNSESKIILLDKRIEQVNLLLKKLELQG